MRATPLNDAAAASHTNRNPGNASLALLLLVPAPSIGALTAMVWLPGSVLGSVIFTACKLWLFALPVLWHIFIDRQRISLSLPRHGGFGIGIVSGIVISAVILGAYWLVGDALIDLQVMREKIAAVGLAEPLYFALGAAYWILINSVLEEYVWRWFCLSKARQLMPGWVAMVAAAGFFTLHHIIALSVYLGPLAVVLCSAGVFLGGAFWNWMYLSYRSIWPAYISHAIVDVAVFAVGAWVLFG